MESIIDFALKATNGLADVVLSLKPHPDFPIPDRVKEKYYKKPSVNIMSLDVSLSETVKITDLCISAYSSAVFEFAKNSKPIV